RVEDTRIFRASLAGIRAPLDQIPPRTLGEGCIPQLIAPDIERKRRLGDAALLIEVIGDVDLVFLQAIHVGVVIECESERLQAGIPLLITVRARDLKLAEELIDLR